MADIEKIERELRENLASFDAEVAYELENEGERADLWTDIDVPVEAIRALLDELSRLREVEAKAREVLEPFARADRALGDELPGPFRFETARGHRLIEREHLRAARAFLRESLPTARGETNG